MTLLDYLVDYIVAVAKLETDESKAKVLIEKSIKEFVNRELQACIVVTEEQKKEWGETARNSSWTVKDIADKLKERMHKID